MGIIKVGHNHILFCYTNYYGYLFSVWGGLIFSYCVCLFYFSFVNGMFLVPASFRITWRLQTERSCAGMYSGVCYMLHTSKISRYGFICFCYKIYTRNLQIVTEKIIHSCRRYYEEKKRNGKIIKLSLLEGLFSLANVTIYMCYSQLTFTEIRGTSPIENTNVHNFNYEFDWES